LSNVTELGRILKADERDRFIGRSAYILYGARKNITIQEIDWSSNEKTIISDQNVTVGEYLKIW